MIPGSFVGILLYTKSIRPPSPSFLLFPTSSLPPSVPPFASLFCFRISNGSQYPGGDKGVRGSSPSPRPSPNAAQLPFRTLPLQPIHPGEPPPKKKKKRKRKKSGYLLEYLFCIVLCHTKDVHYVRSRPLSQRETITWNCLF